MATRIAELLHNAIERLRDISPSARLDAEVLLRHVCGLGRTALIAQASAPLAREQVDAFNALLARRLAGEPVAYLIGHREFWSLDLVVTADTLIPRPETEILVEQALHHIPPDSDMRIADLGTGSGAIALSVAKAQPRCRIIATDVSPAALEVARHNAARHAVRNIEFRVGDWYAALGADTVDWILSNPPYVADEDPHLRTGDVRFEPRTALHAGSDGLDAIRRLIAGAASHLSHAGGLLLEHGATQGEAVRALLTAHGFTAVQTYRDLSGHERVTHARRERAA